ncbi:hypothetical protein [Paracoccus siganidrum]|uniref:Uncharacterized protein n=1 Tax=Paracoccus siganidrum TaxID=1276757 RepID=A0A419A3R9_9RHOB|nr:hypothetical protein [Paracoccus siganidrum]RJL08403.1 hypothetical protein D3P05_16160 [Paracoccus siganidrum]RMC39314.1 hypothetical protein C9E82_04870 [Paracoccus siganidrum]
MSGNSLIWDGRKAITAYGTYEIMPEESADEGGYWLYRRDGVESEKQYFTEGAAKLAVQEDFDRRLSEVFGQVKGAA